jgi:alpha-beta hydrolase superfamily lysophospholipase
MSIRESPLPVVVDGLRLAGGVCVPEEPHGLVVFLHGIPSIAPPDIDDEGYPGLARYFAAAGWAAAWVDMRGARASQGFFSIGGWVRDARATVDAARSIEGVSALPVALVGSSAGGAVAVEATRRGAPVDALALLAAPAAWVSFAHDTGDAVTRITEEAGMLLSPEVLADPAAWVSEFEQVVTEKAISSLRIPVLIVHGTEDDVVPVDHARRIADRARNPELVILEGAPHQLRRHPPALEATLEWLGKTLR